MNRIFVWLYYLLYPDAWFHRVYDPMKCRSTIKRVDEYRQAELDAVQLPDGVRSVFYNRVLYWKRSK